MSRGATQDELRHRASLHAQAIAAASEVPEHLRAATWAELRRIPHTWPQVPSRERRTHEPKRPDPQRFNSKEANA